MNFTDFLNEATIRFSSASFTEIARHAVESKGKEGAIKYLASKLRHFKREEPNNKAMHNKILMAMDLISKGSTSKEETSSEKEEETSKQKTRSYNFNSQSRPSATSDVLKGLKICLTGKGPFTRKEIEEDILKTGGYPSDIKKADLLVTSDPNSNSSKMKNARAWRMKVISYEELYKMMNSNKESEKKDSDWQKGGPFDEEKRASNKADYYILKVKYGTTSYKGAYDEIQKLIYNSDEPLFYQKVQRIYRERAKAMGLDKKDSFKSEYANFTNQQVYDKVTQLLAPNNSYELVMKHISRRLDAVSANNDGDGYRFWTAVKGQYLLRYKEKQQKTNREQRTERPARGTFTQKDMSNVKPIIFKDSDKISAKDITFKSMLMKLHPDFHKDNQEDSTEKSKIILANKNNPDALRRYAREWGLLKEAFYSELSLFDFLMEKFNK